MQSIQIQLVIPEKKSHVIPSIRSVFFIPGPGEDPHSSLSLERFTAFCCQLPTKVVVLLEPLQGRITVSIKVDVAPDLPKGESVPFVTSHNKMDFNFEGVSVETFC